MATVEKSESTSEIVFTQKWFRNIYILTAIIFIVDLVLLILFNTLAVPAILRITSGTTPFYLKAVRTVLIVGLVVLFYVSISGFLNYTKIEVTRSKVGIIYSPLPWFGRGEIPSDRLTSIRVEETHKGGSKSYSVKAELTDTTHVLLFKDIDDGEQAKSITSDIETFLNIEKA